MKFYWSLGFASSAGGVTSSNFPEATESRGFCTTLTMLFPLRRKFDAASNAARVPRETIVLFEIRARTRDRDKGPWV